MLHSYYRCSHCGKLYIRQDSGMPDGTNNKSHEDFCPQCYELIKPELEALESKLKSDEMKKRKNRYLHAYLVLDDITLDDIKKYFEENGESFEKVCMNQSWCDDWGARKVPYFKGHEDLWIRSGKICKKVLVDTVKNEIVSEFTSKPKRYQESVFGLCTDCTIEMYDEYRNKIREGKFNFDVC